MAKQRGGLSTSTSQRSSATFIPGGRLVRGGLAIAAVVLVVGFGGCLGAPGESGIGEGPPGDGETPGDPSAASTNENGTSIAAFTTVVEPDSVGTEPTLGVIPNGTLFTYTRPDSTNGITAENHAVYRSTDGGHNWTRVYQPSTPTQADPELVVGEDGTVWFHSLTGYGCNVVVVSSDGGESWFEHPAICHGPARDRPRMVATETGTAYLLHQGFDLRNRVLKTTDYGRTWQPLDPLELNLESSHGWPGEAFHNDATGAVYFPFTLSVHEDPTGKILAGGTEYRAPGYAVTADGGASWRVETVPDARWNGSEDRTVGAGLVAGAAGPNGTVYLAWAELRGDQSVIRLAVSEDDGGTWRGPYRVDGSQTSEVFPTVAAGAQGRLAIAYYQASEPGRPQSVPSDALWNVTVAWTDQARSPEPSFHHAPLSQDPILEGPLCTEGVLCSAGQEGSRALLDFFEVEGLASGKLGAVWSNDLVGDGSTTVTIYGQTERSVLAPGHPVAGPE